MTWMFANVFFWELAIVILRRIWWSDSEDFSSVLQLFLQGVWTSLPSRQETSLREAQMSTLNSRTITDLHCNSSSRAQFS